MIAHLSKSLHVRASLPEVAGIQLRNFAGADDVASWLVVRNVAFAGQTSAARPWTEKDFRREFLDKSGWRPDWMWLAEAEEESSPLTVGVAAMTTIKCSGTLAASVSWLAVLPEWQRRGVGRLLIAALEAAAWDAGLGLVLAETRSDWAPAMRFYQTLGYERHDHTNVQFSSSSENF
jgi:GNAT superfamily N-acetyltransferase